MIDLSVAGANAEKQSVPLPSANDYDKKQAAGGLKKVDTKKG
jgi:hypothetical protein